MSKPYGRQVKPDPKDGPRPLRAKTPRFQGELVTVQEKVAQSKYNDRNWFLPKLKELYPDEMWMWFIDRRFPHAEGGELFMDEPRTEAQVWLCKTKSERLKKFGLRYCYFTEGMKEDELRRQLEGICQLPGQPR